jgi:formylglycine-generating enzyme required for sulfatase activity
MVSESHPVKCGGCHRTVRVAVSNLHPPCFRDFEEQAECPEVLTRRRSNGEMLLLMMCSALQQSLNEKFENTEVEPAAYEGGWRVVCRTPDNGGQIFSPNQARRQAELWEGYGQTKLANEFRKAADEAERRRFPGGRPLVGSIPKPIAVIGLGVIALAVASSVAWYLLMWESTQPVVGMTPAEPKPEAASPAAGEPLPSQATATMPEQPQLKPPNTPEMVSLPGGTFTMGSSHDDTELPTHRVAIKPFEMSKFPISVREWNECVAAKACQYVPTGDDAAPVTNLSWSDTQQFLTWLNQLTQKNFRLPSEAEWEYAARGGTDTNYWWGDQFQEGMADCKGCINAYDSTQPLKVGSLKPNPFGLYDMGGDVDQWVEDCWHSSYQGAPVDGSPWIQEDCLSHVVRSGSWKNDPSYVRSASRDHYDTNVRYPTHGFRIARSL